MIDIDPFVPCAFCKRKALHAIDNIAMCGEHYDRYRKGESAYALSMEIYYMSEFNTVTGKPMPEPTPTDGPSIHDLVLQDVWTDAARTIILQRRAFGLEKYGTLLQAFNGRPAFDDLVIELADAVCYARQAVEEGRLGNAVYRLLLADLEVVLIHAGLAKSRET